MFTDTLSLSSVAVKLPKTVGHCIVVPDDSAEAMFEQSFAWGKEDATEGLDMRGSEYFAGAALASYNEGYAAGLVVRKQLEGDSDELAFMAGVLASLRAGATKPVVRLTKAQMDEIEEERIGNAFSTQPYLF